MFKDIMVAMTRTNTDETALAVGIGLAKKNGAQLGVIIPVEFPVPVPNEWGVYPYQMYSAFYDDALKNAESEAEKLRSQLSGESIRFNVRVESTVLMTGPQTCSLYARHCDLIIVGAAAPGQKNYPAENYFVELLMNSGRPVLRVPHTLETDCSFERIVIAWQPCREATRAVHDAIPFLHEAKNIEILMIDPHAGEKDHGELAGTDIADHLARHGLQVNVVRQPSMGETVGNAIVRYAQHTNAQLLVAGGYSHSRFREFILGGVTKELNAASTIPILFAH